MRWPKKAALPFTIVAAGALMFGAVGAQAQVWTPANEGWDAEATDSQLEYDGATIQCDLSEAGGNTNGSSGSPTDYGLLTSLSFGPQPVDQNCSTSTGADVDSIDIDGLPWGIIAHSKDPNNPGSGDVKFHLPSNSGDPVATVVTSGFFADCEIKIGDDQKTNASSYWDADNQTLDVHAEVSATANAHSGGSCALASSDTAIFTGTYERVNQGSDPDIEIG